MSQEQVKLFTQMKTEQYKPAPTNKRVFAFIIDGIIASVFSGILSAIFRAGVGSEFVATVLANFILLPFIYWVLIPIKFGATPGKKLFGLKIVTDAYNLHPTMKQMIMRESVGRICSTIVFGLGYIWTRINKEGKTWHDMMSHTRVIELPVNLLNA